VKYALLVCEDPALFPKPGQPEYEAMMAEYDLFTGELDESGERVGGLRLTGPDTATSVRVRNDDVVLTDGPFAETREHLGGFYIVDVASRERAMELAARIPGARFGVVEVRPVDPHY
jgi:hypothetical protein